MSMYGIWTRPAAENGEMHQQHSERAVGDVIARVQHIRKLHDDYIVAELNSKTTTTNTQQI